MTSLRSRILRFSAPLILLFLAAGAHAQTTVPNTTGIDKIGTFLLSLIYLIDRYVVPLIFALAFIVFIIGVYRYFILGAANEEKRKEGQQFVMYGLIGFVLMLSVWGIINLLVGTFGFGSQTRPPLPTFGSPTAGGTAGTGATTNTTGSPATNFGTNGSSNVDANGVPANNALPY